MFLALTGGIDRHTPIVSMYCLSKTALVLIKRGFGVFVLSSGRGTQPGTHGRRWILESLRGGYCGSNNEENKDNQDDFEP